MSRSYRKNPIRKDSANARDGKKSANRAVRRNRLEERASGGAYRKEFESWDISDFQSRQTKEAFRREWEGENGSADPKSKEYKKALYEWKKRFTRK